MSGPARKANRTAEREEQRGRRIVLKLDEPLIDIRTGKSLINPPRDEDSKPTEATFKTVILDALLAAYKDEEKLAGEEKLSRWRLAQRIANSGEHIDLTIPEAHMVEILCNKLYGAQVYGPIHDAIEGVE